MYSAKSVGGTRLYALARQGKEVKREPVSIHIHSLELVSYYYPSVSVRAIVSPGTYIRTLAEDIGRALGTGAYCAELRRTAIGPYAVSSAVPPERALTERGAWITIEKN